MPQASAELEHGLYEALRDLVTVVLDQTDPLPAARRAEVALAAWERRSIPSATGYPSIPSATGYPGLVTRVRATRARPPARPSLAAEGGLGVDVVVNDEGKDNGLTSRPGLALRGNDEGKGNGSESKLANANEIEHANEIKNEIEIANEIEIEIANANEIEIEHAIEIKIANEISNERASASKSAEDQIAELYEHWLGVLDKYAGGIHPSRSRVNAIPSLRVKGKMEKVLREAPLETCKRAIEGAYVYWTQRGTKGKGITDVFATYRGTGDLASRITFFASLSDTPIGDGRTTQLGLDAPGVRSRMEDARREFRAALDLPDNQPYQRRAAETERWVNSLGMMVVLRPDRAFVIEPTLAPSLVVPVFCDEPAEPAPTTDWRERLHDER